MPGSAAEQRIETLTRHLGHYDLSQLTFQLVEIAGELTYLRHGIEVHDGDVVLDVGANVGVAAAFFAIHCGAGTVHCFEPVRPLAHLLRSNVEGLSACTVHEYGLSRAPGTVSITYYPSSAAMSGLYADPKRDLADARAVLANFGFSSAEITRRLDGRYHAQTLSCELRTLSSTLREQRLTRVDLLKIDVERAELDVLEGIEDGDWPKINQLAIEVHDEHGRAGLIERMLRERGFDTAVEQDSAMRGTSIRMLYATRR